jgi:hypothetical protein
LAKSITASVGLRGVNLLKDVVTVQRLLNKVPPSEGGPAKPLDDDGSAGTKTNTAIQLFQLHHFGWSGADGRVDPGQQTLAKLNTFDPEPTAPSPVPVPPKPDPLSSDFAIIPAFQGDVFPDGANSTHFTYKVVDLTNNRERIYQLVFGPGAPSSGPFQGFFARFKPRKPTGVSGFDGIGVYMTSERTDGLESKLNLFPPQGGSGISIRMKSHLFKASKVPQPGVSQLINGTFRMVR